MKQQIARNEGLATVEAAERIVPGYPLEVAAPASKVPAPSMAPTGTGGRPLGAQAPKPMSVNRIEPQGVPVNPWAVCGNPVPNRYPYRPDETEWAATNK